MGGEGPDIYEGRVGWRLRDSDSLDPKPSLNTCELSTLRKLLES